MSVLVVGDVFTDIIVMPEGPIVRGSDRRATIRSRPGGSAANLAVWLARLGVPVTFAARVATSDIDGQRAYLRERGVTPALAADDDTPSGMLISIVDADGERSFLTDRGANRELCADDLPASLLAGVTTLVVSGYCFFDERPRQAVRGLLAEAHARAIHTMLDPASVGFLREAGTENFLRWTQGSGTIFANAEEALVLTGSSDPALQVQTLGRGFERVVLKRGSLGAAIGGRRGVRASCPAPAVAVVDSTGAGDAFAAAFIAAERAGRPEEECLRSAVETGAAATTAVGGQPD